MDLTSEIAGERSKEKLKTLPLEAWKRLTAKGGASHNVWEKESPLREIIGRQGSIRDKVSKKSYQNRQLETVDQEALMAAAADWTWIEEN